jgi:hypothetical protein
MRRIPALILCVLTASLSAFGASKADKRPVHPLLKSDSIVWAGLDFSMVRMYGTQDFREPAEIFPNYLEAWNALFVQERIEPLRKMLKKKVRIDTGHMAEHNRAAKSDQVIREDGEFTKSSHITPEDIGNVVRSYKLSSQSGLGLVFVVDRFVKTEGRGAVYLVLFDAATRDVIAAERIVAKAGGFGFRNFWFGVIKNAEPDLRKYR